MEYFIKTLALVSTAILFSFICMGPLSVQAQAQCQSQLFQKMNQDVLLHHYDPLATGETSYDNRIGSKVYIGSKQIFVAAKELIENAKQQILYQTWNFDYDSLPATLLASAFQNLAKNRAKAKAKKPIDVWLIINVTGLQSYRKERQGIIDFIEKHKLNNQYVQIRAGIYRANLLGANHVKNIIVDNKYGLVTGANTSNLFNDDGLFDAGFVVSGSSTNSMSKDFIQIWRTRFPDHAGPALLPIVKVDVCLPVLFTRNDSFPNFSTRVQSSSINWALINSVEMAENEINIFTPSLNVTEFISSIERAVKRGLTVKLILSKEYESFMQSLPTRGGTNIENIEEIFSRLDKSIDRKRLCQLLQIKWYSANGVNPALKSKGPNSHVKFMSVDNQVSYIGSSNMDRQSWVNSREIGLFIDSSHLASEWNKQLFNPAFQRGIDIEECGGPKKKITDFKNRDFKSHL